MTGVYVRVEREGRFLNIEFDQLTDDEMRAFLLEKTRNGQHGWISGLAVILAVWIRDHVIEYVVEPPDDGDHDGNRAG